MTRTIDATHVNVRWLIRRDLDEVQAIEDESFPYPWVEEEFIMQLRQRNCIGLVAEHGFHQIVGYMIYELHKGMLKIITLAVDPSTRFSGIGRKIIDRLKAKLSPSQRRFLDVGVRESNLDAQLFFSKLGFRAIDIVRVAREVSLEDEILFRFECPPDGCSD